MSGSSFWMIPGIATGQPGMILAVGPSIAYRRPLEPAAAAVTPANDTSEPAEGAPYTSLLATTTSSCPAPVRSPIAGSLIDSAIIALPACCGSTSATGYPGTG